MPMKDILVHVDGGADSERRLRAAVALARRHEAAQTALFVIDTAYPFYSIDASFGYLGWSGAQPMLDELVAQARAAAARMGETFERLVASEGVAGAWRCVEGSTSEVVLWHAYHADLCVLGQEDPARATWPPDGLPLERVLFAAGRPILVIPFGGEFERTGTEILLGWKPGREPARAANDVLPLLAAARRVTVLTVSDAGSAPDSHQDASGIVRHLARHGVAATSREAVGGRGDEGTVLLAQAADLGADLLVIGAYGHSRTRELVLGGATRTILRHATLPVLMSH